jgi:DNA-binding MarR family transcriptional regulator
VGLFGSRRRGAAEGLRPAELWILLVLKAAGGACGEAKIMGILFLLDVVYGVTGAALERGPWSGEVECALRRLVGLGLVEELPPERAGAARAYRLTEKGRRAVERIPLEDPRWRLPYEDAAFFARWRAGDLVEYIRVNYPEYVAAARDGRVGRPTV